MTTTRTKKATTKVCATCRKKLRVDAFGTSTSTSDRLNPSCRACRRRTSNERNAFLRSLEVDAGYERAEALEVAKALRAGLTAPLAPARKSRAKKGAAD